MKFILTLLLALSAPIFSAQALVRLDFKINEAPLAFLIEPYTTIQIEGLPYVGIHLYSIKSDVLYIQHPDEENWLALPLGNLGSTIPTAYLEKGQESGGFLGTPNRHWAIRVGTRICEHVFANQDTAKKLGTNISHLARISTGLNYIYGSNVKADSCANYLINPAVGQVVGLPIHSSTTATHASQKTTRMDVTRFTTLKGQGLPQPEITAPFDLPAQIRFLERQLSQEARTMFQKTSLNLPQLQQLRALRHLISQN